MQDNRFSIQMGFDDYYVKFHRLHKLMAYLITKEYYKKISFVDISDIDRVVVRRDKDDKLLTSMIF